MDAVVLPLLSTTNPLDPEVLPKVRDGAFWEARWQRLSGLKSSYSGVRWFTNDLPCLAPAGEVLELGIPEREASGARLVCETSEFMVWLPFFARSTDKVLISPRGSVAFCADLDPAQQEPLVATMVEGPIRYHNQKRVRSGRESGTASGSS